MSDSEYAAPPCSPIPAIQSAVLNIGTAASDCGSARDAWIESNWADAVMWINNAISQLESARAKIEAHTANATLHLPTEAQRSKLERLVGRSVNNRRMTMEVQTCEFVSATDIVPRGWDKWFWEAISENAPFSWGDNNRSLVTASDFANHCEERLDDSPEVKRFLKKVRLLGEMYIDLES